VYLEGATPVVALEDIQRYCCQS